MTFESLFAIWAATPAGTAERDARGVMMRFVRHWQNLPRDATSSCPSLRAFLDGADPQIQPGVALIDVTDDGRMPVRLYATRRESAFGRNLTGSDARDAYPAALRDRVWTSAREIVDRPTGLFTTRVMTSVQGLSTSFLSLSVPLATPRESPKCFVNYTAPVGIVPDEPQLALVNTISRSQWIDLGAGTPQW